jgi:hypothetical protein
MLWLSERQPSNRNGSRLKFLEKGFEVLPETTDFQFDLRCFVAGSFAGATDTVAFSGVWRML